MEEKIIAIIERYDRENDTECHDDIEQLLMKNNITQYKVSVDHMFDSSGYDVYSVSVAWIENGELKLVVNSIGIS